ncbi:Dyp-type peroxidase family [Amycolatopsis xylanica]|uniref:Dyp-type peroxidase family n=1 Tax=Amycolatopsis xylanica TaxID=589385 RepID=A0A1H3N628_9PSEU|nr:peroxidase [Amycolatopsis xylanica]SDY84411.1 Dyp-type peroxidase family [Amycolatopsis xylanica]
MSIDLSKPLRWKSADETVRILDELQPNIVKAHVRDHLSMLFLAFEDTAEAAAFLTGLAGLMKSAKDHLLEIEAFKNEGAKSSPYVGVGLTASGYAKLDIPEENRPADRSFTTGMKSTETRRKLNDPPRSGWDPAFREDIDAVVLIGDATDAGMAARRGQVEDLMPDSVIILGEETGFTQFNAQGDPIEHFGYVDGRSQPLFLLEDYEDERDGTDGVDEWDPRFGLDRVVVADPAAPDPGLHFGSYFVFRKLEQNVRRFKQAEQDLADELGFEGEDRERAGALIVGRFEDGTPVTDHREAGAHGPVPNDFSYDSDGEGHKCPFHAHIRKSNPRGSGGFEPVEAERLHIMARRGQTYGERLDDPNADLPPSARPSGGVGLLFMAFNSNIGQQFDFVQTNWANGAGFPRVPDGASNPGRDLVIGQGPREDDPTYATEWGSDVTKTAAPSPQAVTLKGGEYFFMPSLAFLRGLSPQPG